MLVQLLRNHMLGAEARGRLEVAPYKVAVLKMAQHPSMQTSMLKAVLALVHEAICKHCHATQEQR